MERKPLGNRGGSTEQDVDPLMGGTCTTMSPEFIDKTFFAVKTEDLFRYNLAVDLCARCCVKAACLEDAIASPNPVFGVRAGQDHHTLQLLHTEFLAGTPVQQLVDRTMQKDTRKSTRRQYRHPKPSN